MALGAAESDEDVRLPAPNRDREGADVFTGVSTERSRCNTYEQPY
jgi:hypothetical protein